MNRYLIGKGSEMFGDRFHALASAVTMAALFNMTLLVDWDDPFWPDARGGFYRYFTLADLPYVTAAEMVPSDLETYPAWWRHGRKFEIDEQGFTMAEAPSYDPREGLHREPVWVYGGFGAPAGDYHLLKEHLRLTAEAVEALRPQLVKVPAGRPLVFLPASASGSDQSRWAESRGALDQALIDAEHELPARLWIRQNPGSTLLDDLFGGNGIPDAGDRFGASIRRLASFLVLASASEAYSPDEQDPYFMAARSFGQAGGVRALFAPVPEAVSLPSGYPGYGYHYRCSKGVWQQGGSAETVQGVPDAHQATMQQAVALHQQGEIAGAERLFNQLLCAIPGDADALHMLGVIDCQRGDFAGAVDRIARAIAGNPRNAAYHSDLGFALQLLGRFEEALEQYDQALTLNPALAISHLNRGDVLTELNQEVAAAESYSRAEMILRIQSTDAESLHRLGLLERRKKHMSRAAELFSHAVMIEPHRPEWHQDLGITLQELRRFDEALQSYDRALEINSGLLTAQLNRGNILRTLKRMGEASDSDEKAALILVKHPEDAESMHLLGIIEFRRKRYREAVVLFDRALGIDPANAACHSDRGLAFRELRQFGDALACYDQALRLDPDLAVTELNRGNLLRLMKRNVDAGESDRLAAALLEKHLDDADSLHMLGLVEYRRKNLERAVDLIGRAIEINPHNAAFYSDRGYALQDMRCFDAALACYDKALALDQTLAITHLNRGNVLREFMVNAPALESYARAQELIEQQPQTAENLHLLGTIAFRMRNLEASVDLIGRAIDLEPENAGYYSDLGLALQEMTRYDDALRNYDKALSLDPGLEVTHFNRANTFRAQKRFDAAFECYDKALSIKPDYWDVYWNKSLDLLMIGDLDQGFELYEWRWKRNSSPQPMRNFHQPVWHGRETLEGKVILLHSEQGLGDTLQFCRYVRMVKALGPTVVLEVDPPLLELLRPVDGADMVVARGDALPPFDTHCPLLSLPLAFKTRLETIPSGVKYLQSSQEKLEDWARRLGPRTMLRVGIAWSGRAEHLNDHNRSMTLAPFLEQLPEGLQYVSLQKEVRPADLSALLSTGRILHFGELLIDYADTAALCDLMDLVVTIDTSVAHLGAALGKPVWIMLPFMPDWRWLLDREDSPWYPTVRLFRQHAVADWSEVYRRVRCGLELFREEGVLIVDS
ncbi:MAG: tetratricopeptide repeat protein [Chlorobiaceae bacterium]|nr:tetratricopeptide repeat protein [Chlorobiaceae bacterium]